MFRAFGRYIQGLNGRYITAEDVGTTVEDMDIIHDETDYVTGISPAFGSSGNPSPVTAYGVYKGMKAARKRRLALIHWKVKQLPCKAWEMWLTIYAATFTKKALL